MNKITNTPDNWRNPFGKWYDKMTKEYPEFFSDINVPRVTKKIHVVDVDDTYILSIAPDGKRFIKEDKLKNAEALGLSVRRA